MWADPLPIPPIWKGAPLEPFCLGTNGQVQIPAPVYLALRPEALGLKFLCFLFFFSFYNIFLYYCLIVMYNTFLFFFFF